jgi:hypothetical protein
MSNYRNVLFIYVMFKYTKEGTQKRNWKDRQSNCQTEKGQTDKNVDNIKV